MCSPRLWLIISALKCKIASELLPSIFGCEISPNERSIFFHFPLVLEVSTSLTQQSQASSTHFQERQLITDVVINSLKKHTIYDPDTHINTLASVQSEKCKQKELILDEKFKTNIQKLSSLQKRAIQQAKYTKMSSWLNVLPVAKHQFDLSASEFWDALALRYKKPLPNPYTNCDGCGSPFDLSGPMLCLVVREV